jgi:hypothetical protein
MNEKAKVYLKKASDLIIEAYLSLGLASKKIERLELKERILTIMDDLDKLSSLIIDIYNELR